MNRSFAETFLEELAQIENECAEFSEAHPSIAPRLGLGAQGSVDPDVRQLIESVAFIATRLRRQLDSVGGELIVSIMRLISPPLVRSIPSLGVVRLSPRGSRVISPFSFPAGAMLVARTASDPECHLTMPLGGRFLPLNVRSFWNTEDNDGRDKSVANSSAKDCFVIRVSAQGGMFKVNAFECLDFFVSAPINRALAAVEALTVGVTAVRIAACDGSWQQLMPSSIIKAIGFRDPAERLLPASNEMDALDNGVLEFLHFPHRFAFFKVNGIAISTPCSAFDIVFEVKKEFSSALDAVRGNIAANCFPVANLRRRNANTVILDPFQSEYAVTPVGDVRGGWDVYSIDEVKWRSATAEALPEYYESLCCAESHRLSWTERWKERVGSENAHANAYVALIDDCEGASGSVWSAGEALYLKLTCSQCHLPESLMPGAALEVKNAPSELEARLEVSMSPYVGPLTAFNASPHLLMRAIAQRSFTLSRSLATIKNFLRSRNRAGSVFAEAQIGSIKAIEASPILVEKSEHAFGALTAVGIRYNLSFVDSIHVTPGQYFLAAIFKELMTLRHDASIPVEVRILTPEGSLFEC